MTTQQPGPVAATHDVPDDRVHGDTPVRRPPSSRPWWLMAGLGAALVVVGGVGVTSWDGSTGGLWGSVDQQQTYDRAVGALTVAGGSSDVEIRGGGTPGSVVVHRHLSWGPGSGTPTPKESWDGSTLTIGAECGGLLGWCSVDYVITVPDSTDVSVDVESGDITVGGGLGGVRLTAGSGDIDATSLRASRVTAETTSGDVDLALESAATPVDVRTGSGDATVRLPRGTTYAVDAVPGSGDRDVRVSTDPGSSSTLQVRTGSGDIEVDYR